MQRYSLKKKGLGGTIKIFSTLFNKLKKKKKTGQVLKGVPSNHGPRPSINITQHLINDVTVWSMYGSLPLQSCSSSLQKLYWWRVVHSHFHFGHSCLFEWESQKGNKNTQTHRLKESPGHPPTTLFSGGGGMMQPWSDCLADSFS